jgi:hypothetical protein
MPACSVCAFGSRLTARFALTARAHLKVEPAGMWQLRAKSAAIVRERQDLMATISQLRHELDSAQHQQQPLRASCSTARKFPAEHDPMAWFSQPSPSSAELSDGLAIRHEAATPPDSAPKARGVEAAAAAVVARAVVGAAASPAPRSPQPSAKAEDDLDSGWMHFSLPSTTSSYAMHSPESWSASRQACAPLFVVLQRRSKLRHPCRRTWRVSLGCAAAEGRVAPTPNVQWQLRAIRHDLERQPSQLCCRQSGQPTAAGRSQPPRPRW